jgi:NACalpha-BTF3-like transcription factor
MSEQADLDWNGIMLSELPFQSFDDHAPIPLAALPFQFARDSRTTLPFRYIAGNSSGFFRFPTATPMMNLPEEITSLLNLIRHDNLLERQVSETVEAKLIPEKYSGDDCICSLCIEDIENGTDIYRLKCNHIFHARKCLDDKGIIDWINNHKTCPYCRAKIIVPSTTNDLDEEEIETIMMQTDESRENAIHALRRHGNVIDAILDLTPLISTSLGSAVNGSGFNEDIETIIAQTGTSRENAIRALSQHGNIIDAILDLTP